MSRAPGPADVLQALQRGQFHDALAKGRQVLLAHPRNADLLQLVAIAAMQSQQTAEGVDLLRRAHALRQSDPGIAFNLAKALGEAGMAEEGFRLATRREFAANADFRRLSGELARAAGRHKDARAIYSGLLQASPNDPELLNNLGSACMAEGDLDAAIAAFGRARAIEPALVAVLVNLAKAHGLAGEPDKALEAAQRAADLEPGMAETSLELARALRSAGQPEQALAVLVPAFEANQASADIAVEIGFTFSAMAEFEQAEEAYRNALKCDPRNAQALLNLGILLEQANQLTELDSLVQFAAVGSVAGPEVDFITALALRRSGDLAGARSLALKDDPEDAVNPGVRFHLLGQVSDQLGLHDEAWQHFTAMNDAAAKGAAGRHFAGSEYHDYIRSVSALLTPEWAASWQGVSPPDRQSPAFLVGFPRSGTTLLDTMLMGHPGLHVLEEEPVLAAVHDEIGDLTRIPELGQADVERLREAYFAGVEGLGPVPQGSMIVDKLPLNLLRAPLIHRLFPDARFILALRHPCDAVQSCFMQNFRVNRAMASFWTIDNAARTYDLAFGFWEKCRALMPLNVHAIHYEDLIEDQRGEISRLADFLGIELDEAMLDNTRTAKERGRVRTPSYAQITEGLHRRASGRWLKYRDHLAPALPILDPWAVRFGYDPLTST